MIHKLQLLVVSTTTIGVWSNLYLTYKTYETYESCKGCKRCKRCVVK